MQVQIIISAMAEGMYTCLALCSLCVPMQTKRRLTEMLQSLPLLSRWAPVGNPLYHRHLGLQWHDMCAESLGMSKVALLFLTRGPVHQASSTFLIASHPGVITIGQASQKPKGIGLLKSASACTFLAPGTFVCSLERLEFHKKQ